jgi:SynChlorMet cassette radical SAM/SPASM protein ScmF
MNETKERMDNKERPLPRLGQIYFYLTEGCNLACRHCWIAPKFDAQAKLPALAVNLFEKAISEARSLGLEGVKLTGGEPLMHPRFVELLEIVNRAGLSLSIETNGVLCTAELAAEIAKNPRRHVSVSIDGADAATYEWIRGIQGSFEAAKEGIKNLVALGTNPQIIFTVMRKNVGQVEKIVDMAKAMKANSVKFNIVQPTARGESMRNAGETLGVEELLRVGRWIEMDLAPKAGIPLIFDYPYSFKPLSRISRGEGCGRCSIMNIMGVIASGHYALCGISYHVPELIFGQVGKDSLEHIWRTNLVLNALRSGLPQKLEGICGKCLMKYYCLGSCIAQNYYSTGSLWAPYWFCDQAHKAGIFPLSRINEIAEA